MSYRDRNRLSGYRSQPVSNRTSLYLSSDFNVGLTEDLTDFDRQFKKLLERTETFTNRVERLHSTSSYLKKGFRGVDTTLTRLRRERDVIGTSYGNLEHRIFNEDDQTTEEEWKRLLDAGILIEKAVELVRQRYRFPKPVYEYSPESRSPQAYEAPHGTILLPNPKSPRDREGKRIRDLGSEIKDHDTTSIVPTPPKVVVPTPSVVAPTTSDVVTSTTDVAATNGTPATTTQRDRDRPPCAKRIKKSDNEKSKSLQSLKEIDEEPDILIEKPKIRARLANQLSKDTSQSDTESKPTKRTTTESKLATESKPSPEAVATPPLRKSKTIEERRQSIRSLMEADTITSDKEETPPRTETPKEEKRLSAKSSFDAETTRPTTQTPDTTTTRAGRTLDERRSSIKSLADTGKTTTSISETRQPTISVSDVGKSMTSLDDSRLPTSDSLSSLRSSNLSQSTHSLYSATERYKTRSERLLESERSDRFKDYSSSDRTRSSAFRSESVFAERKDKENDSSMHEDDDDKSKDARRPSLFKTLKNAASRSKKRPTSSIYEDTMNVKREQDQKKSLLSPDIEEESSMRRKASDHLMYTNAELIKMAQEDLEKGKGKKKLEESLTPTTKKKPISTSSFHEYHPDKRVPLKERLKNKMSETSTSTDDDSSVASLSTRTSRLSRDKTAEKDDSLRSRFLRRFRLGSDEKGEEKKESHERRHRKKSEDTMNAAKAKDKVDEEKKEGEKEKETKSETRSSRYQVKDQGDPSKYDSYSNRAMKMSMEHRLTSIDIEMEKDLAAGTSLADIIKKEEDNIKVDMSKYNVYSYRSRHSRLRDDSESTRSPRYEREKSSDALSSRKSNKLDRQKSSDSTETAEKRSRTTSHTKDDKSEKTDKHSSKLSEDTDDSKDQQKSPRQKEKEETKKESKSETKSVMSIRERNKNKDTLKEPKSDFVKDDLPSPKGIARRINPTYSFDKPKEKETTRKEITKLNLLDLDRRSLYINEEVIRPVVKNEDIKMEFKSPRRSLSDEVIEEIVASSVTDQVIKDDFFKVLLQREVSEEEVSIVGAEKEEPEVLLDNLFDQLNQLPSVRSSMASSDGRNRESASSELSTSETNKSMTTSFDELSESSDVFINGNRSSSSADLFAKIEKANDKLYTGLLNLTTKVKTDESDNTVHDSDESSNEKRNVNKMIVTSTVTLQDTTGKDKDINDVPCNDITSPVDVTDNRSEKISVSDSVPSDKDTSVELKSDDVKTPHDALKEIEIVESTPPENLITVDVAPATLLDEKLDHSPFKLTRTKKIDDNGPVAGAKEGEEKKSKDASFDKAVDEATKDVNQMLSNCDSIDKISNDLQRTYTPGAKSTEDLSSNTMERRSQSASPSRKRSSYLEKRTSHLKLFQSGEQSASSEDVRSDSAKSSKESLDAEKHEAPKNENETEQGGTSGESTLLAVEEVDVVKIVSDTSVESSVLDEIVDTVEENITLDELTLKIPDESRTQEENKNEININESEILEKNNNNNDEMTDNNQVPNSNTNKKTLLSSKSLDEDLSMGEDGELSNRGKLAAMRNTQSVEVKSLEEIRCRLDEIKSSSVTSLVNVNVIVEGEGKPPAAELKSLDQIKSRLEQIKARKKQLKLLEINKNLSVDKDAGITPQVTDVRISNARTISVEQESEDEKSATEENFINIPMSPIRKIKLSTDFLEESDTEVLHLENGDAIVNDKVFEDSSNSVILNGNKSNVQLNSNQSVAICNVPSSTNGHAITISSQNGESDVKDSVEKLLNEVAVAESNEEKRKMEVPQETRTAEKTEDEPIQNDKNKSNECEIIKSEKTGDDDVFAATNETVEDGGSQKVCVTNGHAKEQVAVDKKESGEHSSLGQDAGNLSASTASETHTTTTKTKDSHGSENGHAAGPKIPKFVFPRQMSIVEYRRKKLEKHPSEPLTDEENPYIKSDTENLKGHKSSVADVSDDVSDDCRVRKKYYRHNKKEIKSSSCENFRSSASEDSDDEDISLVDHLANRFLQRTRGSTGQSRSLDLDTTELTSGRTTSESSRSKNHTQKVNERFKANGNV